MKIAIIGSHGTRKTTLCREIAAWFSRNSKSTEIVQEVARDPRFSINEKTTLESQRGILFKQMLEEGTASERYPHVICDRGVIDNYMYLINATGRQPELERYLLTEWVPSYDLQLYVPIIAQPTDDGIRSTNESFQQKIDRMLLEFLEEKRIVYHKFSPPREDKPETSFLEQAKRIISANTTEEFPFK